MVLPIVMTVLASFKTTARGGGVTADATSRTQLSLDSYQRLWDYQAGLPIYLLNSFGTALLTIAVHARADGPGRLRAGALPDPRQGVAVRLPAAWR